MTAEDRVVSFAEISEVHIQLYELLIGQQIDRALGLAHPERRLQHKQPKRRVIKIVRLVFSVMLRGALAANENRRTRLVRVYRAGSHGSR